MSIIIKRDIKDIEKDINTTDDIICKTLLKQFLKIKLETSARDKLNKLNLLIQQQNESINELTLQETKQETKQINNEIDLERGPNEDKWEFKNLKDIRFSKMQKDDKINNKFMERLNSEIDFRISN
jgi:hypothetical protein